MNSRNTIDALEEKIVAETFCLRMHPTLKEAIGKVADGKNVPMNDVIHKALAEYFGRPELADVPKQPVGRKRKHAVA